MIMKYFHGRVSAILIQKRRLTNGWFCVFYDPFNFSSHEKNGCNRYIMRLIYFKPHTAYPLILDSEGLNAEYIG